MSDEDKPVRIDADGTRFYADGTRVDPDGTKHYKMSIPTGYYSFPHLKALKHWSTKWKATARRVLRNLGMSEADVQRILPPGDPGRPPGS
jgi:hypothetical protein